MKSRLSTEQVYPPVAGRFLLALLLLVGATASYGLEEIPEGDLSAITGEGIAVASNLLVRFNGAGNEPDTGYIRFTPVGPLSQSLVDFNNNVGGVNPNGVKFGKADIYLYGLAISANDNSVGTRFSGNPLELGSAQNPFLIRVGTANNSTGTAGSVYNFDGSATTISYLNVEAPTFDRQTDAFNLKVGAWLDAFVRDPAIAEGAAGQFDLGGVNRANRLRAQAILNGASLSGTSVKLFSTQIGATTANGMNPSYNGTIGLAGTVRLNTQRNPTTVTGPVYTESSTVTQTASSTGTVSSWATLHGGWNTALNPATSGTDCGNNVAGSATSYANAGAAGCQFIVQNRTRTADTRTFTVSKTASYSGAFSSDLMNHALRLSTQESTGATQGLLSTPAINGGSAPSFANGEGLYLFSPNINLVMGTLWQPLTFGLADDKRNLVIELARVANHENVYKQVYTDYTGTDNTYKGGTCNMYWCGDANRNATHSSITIGTTNTWNSGNVSSSAATFATANRLTASSANDATGVYFGQPGTGTNTVTQTGVITNSGVLTEVRYMQRSLIASQYVSWVRNEHTCVVFACGDNTTIDSSNGTHRQWWYIDSTGTPVLWNSNLPASLNQDSCEPGAVFAGTSTCSTGTQNAQTYGTAANSNWGVDTPGGGAYWQSFANDDVNGLIGPGNGITGRNVGLDTLANQAPTASSAALLVGVSGAGVNLGSGVIDGLLIQHLKFTTKGL